MFHMKKMNIHSGGRREHIKQIRKGFLREKKEIDRREVEIEEKKTSILRSLAKMIKLIKDTDQSLYLSQTR